MSTRTKYNSIAGAGGFTLVEILVTVLVMAVGLLGLAGMQALSLRYNHSSELRSQAILQAYSLSDRMRANQEGIKQGAYNNPASINTASCNTTSGCSASQMAQNDFYEWNAQNAQLLPSGSGTVCIDSTPNTPACDGNGNVYVIRVNWVERAEAGTVNKSFTLSFQP